MNQSHIYRNNTLFNFFILALCSYARTIEAQQLDSPKTISMEVESFGGTSPSSKIAAILPASGNMPEHSLEFLSVKKLVSILLQENGYQLSEDKKKVDTVVFVNAGTRRDPSSARVHYLALEAVDYKHFIKTRQTQSYWKLISTTADPSFSLRKALPYLSTAATNFIGIDSDRQNIKLNDNDPRVTALIQDAKDRIPAKLEGK